MNYLHSKLSQNLAWYRTWHQSPSSTFYHWSFFIFTAILVTNVLYSQIQTVDFVLPPNMARAAAAIDVPPGTDIRALVANSPAASTFNIKAGVHRMQQIDPKDNDVFNGEAGAILNGSKLLTGWTQSGNTWFVGGQTQQGLINNQSCRGGFSFCGYPDDVFVDNIPLLQANSVGEVGPCSLGTLTAPGCKYFFDHGAARIYIGINPSGHTVEGSVSQYAFASGATGVTIQNLVVEKYSVTLQRGAIGDLGSGPNWTVQNTEMRLNHGGGIRGSSGWKMLNNHVHDNGQTGMYGGGDDELVQGNEIDHNGYYAGVNYGWEGGGTKFAGTNRLVVRNNWSHHNRGPGLWTDIDNINVLYEGNTSEYNSGPDATSPGIMHEVSYSATIRNNIVRYNNMEYPSGWPWGPQILISTSMDADVHHNKVTVDSNSSGEDAISIIGQGRDFGGCCKYGHYEAKNNYIHDNMIIVTGPGQGRTGLVGDVPGVFSNNNRFDYNSYYVGNLNIGNWVWAQGLTYTGFQGQGQEAHGCASTNNSCPDPTAGLTPPPPGPTPPPAPIPPPPPPVPQTPYAGAIALPGTAQAENFDNGGEGVAYHDNDTINNGGQYRTGESVDVKVSTDTGGGYAVGWMNAGEWLEYSVNVAATGNYDISARVATPNTGKTLHIEFDGADKTGAMAVPVTGAFDTTYATVTKTNVALTAGAHIMRVVADTDLFDLNYITVATTVIPQTPYAGVISVPGTVQAENFDNGGQGVAYNDSDTTNNGGQFRTAEGVDIKASTDTGGGYAVGWMNAGEWLEYTVNVASAGNYDIAARVATPNTGKSLHIEFGGVDKTGAMAIPVTGAFDSAWGSVTKANVTLAAGQQIMRIFADTDLFDLNYITITAHAALAGDLNVDHIVNSLDWSLMNSKWFTTDANADLNHDGLVNAIDFSILNSHWFGTW